MKSAGHFEIVAKEGFNEVDKAVHVDDTVREVCKHAHEALMSTTRGGILCLYVRDVADGIIGI